MFVRCCHCKDCQRQTGSAFAVNALVEADRIERLRGTPQRRALPTSSGRPHIAWFCAECGTTLWSDYGARKVMLFVRVAALDEPAALPPDVHIFTRSRLPWVELSGGAPGFEVYYDMAALWPAESLRRREALLGEGR
jgi:hypothetical protein